VTSITLGVALIPRRRMRRALRLSPSSRETPSAVVRTRWFSPSTTSTSPAASQQCLAAPASRLRAAASGGLLSLLVR
jgi:hypothetical protein